MEPKKPGPVAPDPRTIALLVSGIITRAKDPGVPDGTKEFANLCAICHVCYLLGQGKNEKDEVTYISGVLGFDCTDLVMAAKELVRGVRPTRVGRRARHFNFEEYLVSMFERTGKKPVILDTSYEEVREDGGGKDGSPSDG